MCKIRALVKRPDEEIGHITNISSSLGNLQRTVGGYIECVTIAKDAVIICNEEGRLLGLPDNCCVFGESAAGFKFKSAFCGTIIVLGTKGYEFCDLPEWMTRQKWKEDYLV